MSISTAVRVLVRGYKKKFPGADQADLNEYLKNHVALVIADPKADDKDVADLADAQLIESADNGEQWAINLRDSVLINVVKPVVDKANEKGVDPVTALVLADFTEDQARDYVTALEDRATTPSIPSQSADADGDSALDEGDDEDNSTLDPAVTVSY